MPVAILPTEPRYWWATCAIFTPSLWSPVSSITSTPPACGAISASAQVSSRRLAQLEGCVASRKLQDDVLDAILINLKGWVHRDYEPILDYWRDDEVLATVEAQADLPQGSGVAVPGARWRIVFPPSLFEPQMYPYETLLDAKRVAEERIREENL